MTDTASVPSGDAPDGSPASSPAGAAADSLADKPDESLASWLQLREPVDHASRSETVLSAALSAALTAARDAAIPADGAVRVLDLATGAGSNLRYLIERLPGRQDWLVVDRSPVLLRHLLERTAAWATARGYRADLGDGCLTVRGERVPRREDTQCEDTQRGEVRREESPRTDTLHCEIRTRERDLTSLDGDDLFTGRHLVTASALLDLVSASWLRSLAARCRHVGAAALFTITYDGRTTSHPPEPEDARVLELFNRHQRTDKGLDGTAAGPDSAEAARRAFAEAGFETCVATSDWTLGPAHAALQRELIDGWAHAAREIAPGEAAWLADWLARRLAHVNAASSRVVVGHQDLAAWVPR